MVSCIWLFYSPTHFWFPRMVHFLDVWEAIQVSSDHKQQNSINLSSLRTHEFCINYAFIVSLSASTGLPEQPSSTSKFCKPVLAVPHCQYIFSILSFFCPYTAFYSFSIIKKKKLCRKCWFSLSMKGHQPKTIA